MTKATGADIKTNSPIQPVKYDINKDVLTVNSKDSQGFYRCNDCRQQGKVLHGIFESSYRC